MESMAAPIAVRSFTRASDAATYERCVRLRKAHLWGAQQVNGQWSPPQGSAADYAEADDEALFFAATRGGDVLGTAMLHHDRLRQMVVDDEARGHGVGSSLVSAIVNAAEAKGLRAVRVSAWAKSEAFYAKCGFRAVGEPYLSVGLICQRMELAVPPRHASDARVLVRTHMMELRSGRPRRVGRRGEAKAK